MNTNELLARAKCSVCQKGAAHTGVPLFWTISVDRHGLKPDAIRRHDGLVMMMGSSRLAEVLGPDEEMTVPMMQTVKLTICETCMVEKFPLLMELAFAVGEPSEPSDVGN